MKKYLLKTGGGEREIYYWAGDGWWTRRKDQAKRFDTPEAAEAARSTAVSVYAVEPADADN